MGYDNFGLFHPVSAHSSFLVHWVHPYEAIHFQPVCTVGASPPGNVFEVLSLPTLGLRKTFACKDLSVLLAVMEQVVGHALNFFLRHWSMQVTATVSVE